MNRLLKQERELRGWSQARVAELIGTDATTVSRWERGLFFPTPYFREKLCMLFAKNAEELGLLETASAPLITTPLSDSDEQKLSDVYTLPLNPPSWSQRTDTFSYILRSAAHDQQAHMLWEDAYVRALLGQRREAQQLGEASLSAFERIGHLNTVAVREWLNQRDVVSFPSSPPETPTPFPESVQRPPKKHARSVLHGRGAGFLFLLIGIIGLLSVMGISQMHSFALATPLAYASPAKAAAAATRSVTKAGDNSKSVLPVPTQVNNVAVTRITPVATTLPASVATSTQQSTGKSEQTIAAIPTTPPVTAFSQARISPSKLAPQQCQPDALGLRCTLTLLWDTPDQQAFTWSASSPDVAVLFNPDHGSGISGQPSQIIAYLQSSPGDKGELVFVATSSVGSSTVQASWQD